MHSEARRVGILAGGGQVPVEIADIARQHGHDVHIVAIDGEADADFGTHRVTTVNWGQIGTMVRTLKAARIDALVIVGRVQRPELHRLRPDLGFFLNLPAIIKIVASGGDDSVLRRVVRFFEAQGLTVVGPADVAPDIIMSEGPLGHARPSAADAADMAKGFAVIRALGSFDIGQGVVVSDGRIEAIEGVEGTDRMIERVAHMRTDTSRRRGVLVKRSKPGQDLRVDMPAIGPDTITGIANAGINGVAVEAGKVLVAQRHEMTGRMNDTHVFVTGVADDASAPEADNGSKLTLRVGYTRLGRVDLSTHMFADAERGLAVLQSLASFAPVGRAAVVARNHVLSVEAGEEGAFATVERAAGLKQWRSLTHRRRGVVALAHARDLTPALVKLIDRAGFAGAVFADEGGSPAVAADAILAADQAGISVCSATELGAALA